LVADATGGNQHDVRVDRIRAGTTVITSTISAPPRRHRHRLSRDTGDAWLAGWRTRVHATRLQRSDPGPTRRAVRLGVHLT
jgi:hypothetical protein